MKANKITLCFMAVGLALSSLSAQAEVCDWAKKTPSDDAKYKYFVAREFSMVSRAKAMENAENSITQQVCNILGNYLSTASDSYEDEDISNSTSSSAQRSRCLGVYKQNFEKLETDTGKIDNEYVACVKYRYSLETLRQEQDRRNKEGLVSSSMALNDYIGDADCIGHPLEIKTQPAGAYISIDNNPKYSGITPLRFGNVCNGKHSVIITLKNYDTVKETIGSDTKSIFKRLDRTRKNVEISTNLGNSTITVSDSDGFVLDSGKEPFSYDFLLGVSYNITAKNAHSNTISTSRVFGATSPKKYEIDLEKLPGSIDFTVFKQRNPDVRIFVNDNEIFGAVAYNLNPNKEQKIAFKKRDFIDIYDSISINAGESYNYPSTELTFSKDNSAWAQKKLGFDIKALGGVTISNLGNNYHYGLELGAFKRLGEHVGVRGALGLQYFELTERKTLLQFDKSISNFVWLSNVEQPELCPSGKNCEKVYFRGSAYNYDYGYFDTPVISLNEIKAKSQYFEPLYLNMGLMLGEKLYVYGIGALGFFKPIAEDISESVYDFSMQPYDIISMNSGKTDIVLRYGLGMQWTFNTSGLRYGVRAQYLTSAKLKEQEYNYQIVWAGNVNPNPDYAYKYQIENLKEFVPVKNIQSVNISVFVGF